MAIGSTAESEPEPETGMTTMPPTAGGSPEGDGVGVGVDDGVVGEGVGVGEDDGGGVHGSDWLKSMQPLGVGEAEGVDDGVDDGVGVGVDEGGAEIA